MSLSILRQQRVACRRLSSAPHAFGRKYKSNEDISLETNTKAFDYIYKTSDKRVRHPVAMRTYGGIRGFEFTDNVQGNILTQPLLTHLHKRLNMLIDNEAVGMAMYYTTDRLNTSEVEYFCQGVDLEAMTTKPEHYLTKVHSFALALSQFKKPIVSIFSGVCNGSGYSVFAGAPYKLSTPQTALVLNDLFKGQLPVGGFTYHLTKRNKKSGMQFARYLAVAGASINADEMFSLGMITHITQEDAHQSLAFAMLQSTPENLFSLRQEVEINMDALPDVLQHMHISSDIDTRDHPFWDKAMRIKPVEIDITKYEDTCIHGHVRDIEDIVVDCFSTPSASEALRLLCENSRAFPVLTESAKAFAKLDPQLAQRWFDLTALSADAVSLEECLAIEYDYLTKR